MRIGLSALFLFLACAASAVDLRIGTVNPPSGSVSGGTRVKIAVYGLAAGATVEVRMPEVATILSVLGTNITLLTPPHNGAGKVPIEVIDSAGNTGLLADAFEYAEAPTIKGIYPSVGATIGGNKIYMDGNNFAPGNVAIQFGDTPATGVSSDDNGQRIYCTTPPGMPGDVPVTVTNIGSGSTQATFTYQALNLRTVFSLDGGHPTTQVPATTTPDVTLQGEGFSPLQTIYFGDLPAPIKSVNPTELVVAAPYTQHPGAVDVTVRDPDGNSSTLNSAFAFRQSRPRFDLLSPLPSSGKVWVTITGTEIDLHNPSVLFGRTPALDYAISCDLASNNSLCCLVPPGPPGPVDVTFIGGDGGKFTLSDSVSYAQSPGNDDCANAYALSFEGPMYFELYFANPESAACPHGADVASVWYRFTPPQDGYLDVLSPYYDRLRVDLLADCCGAPLVTPTGCASPGACLSNVPVVACENYLVRVLSTEPYFSRVPGVVNSIYAAFRPLPGAVPCAAEGEGEGEGSAEGEGGAPATNSVDADHDGRVSLSELLRLVQFYRLGIGCGVNTEDGYAPGSADHTCAPYSADYNPRDWQISLSEALRVIQLYTAGAYHPCPEGEDGLCPGA